MENALHKSNGNSVWIGLQVLPREQEPDSRQPISNARVEVGIVPTQNPAIPKDRVPDERPLSPRTTLQGGGHLT